MGGTKRMSMEEKRKVILDIYHKDQQVYTEKEITALAAKAGVNANSIEAVHNGLIDDGLVEKQKIGGSNFFWSFKAKKDRKAQIQHETTLKLVEELKPKVRETEAALADAKRGREDDPEEEGATENGEEENNPENGGGGGRAKKLARLSELAKEKAALEAELAVLKENDPAALADLEKELQLVTQAANRWTDNIFECKSYLVKKRGMEKKEALRCLGISANFDYPEEK